MPTVHFSFDYRSPYSYLAQSQLGDLALEIHPFDEKWSRFFEQRRKV